MNISIIKGDESSLPSKHKSKKTQAKGHSVPQEERQRVPKPNNRSSRVRYKVLLQFVGVCPSVNEDY